MTSPVVLISGQKTRLGKLLGRGGEGDVYFVDGRPGDAVKLYKPDLRGPREAKVLAMVGGGLHKRTGLVAFPLEVATDESGRFAGFVMRLVSKCKPIHELYGPKSRKIQFPNVDYRFLVRAAGNVARAVAAVHEMDCVIGDFNHSGVLVSGTATVALIDADSFQFRSQGRLHRCIVGTEDFTPPELHGVRLSEVERTKAHDHFGLAVAIFQLLAMGRHPYAGRCSDGDFSLGESIAQNRFAFSVARKAATRTVPPPGSIRLQDFPPSIGAAFEAAFGTDPAKRPTAAQWVSLLTGLEADIRQCSTVPAHYFPRSAGDCPWCRLLAQSGIDMFPAAAHPTSAQPAADNFDIDAIWAEISAIILLSPNDLIPSSLGSAGSANSSGTTRAAGGPGAGANGGAGAGVGATSSSNATSTPNSTSSSTQSSQSGRSGSPTSKSLEATAKLRKQRMMRAMWAIPVVLGLLAFPKLFLFWLGLGAMVCFYAKGVEIDQEPLKQALRAADAQVGEAAQEYLKRIGYVDALNLRADLEMWVDQHKALDRELPRALADMANSREARQKAAYLDGFLIRRAKIPGIGPAKTATLASFNIETANDITRRAVMAVPGFGEAYTAKLLAWRQGHEAKFRYNSQRDASDTQAESATRAAWAVQRVSLQNKLRAGLANLKLAHSKLKTSNPLSFSPLREAIEAREAAKRDCQELGISVPSPAPVEISIPKRAAAPPLSLIQPNAQRGASASTPAVTQTPTQTKNYVSPSCPTCNSLMRLRTATKGRNIGKQFWGCSRFPKCKGSRDL
ncbi:hypothetical protein EFP18_21410 [Burkholderia glumae]|uniref:helix-hairpin-helix domain-containing protein n=1 Tax=Burkholderia glumae TaxID=337 RepID=UPI0020CCAE92|nr:hypothetical protein [Burkholderia glumae]MCQ0030991.1 hypothetical protein [Burkholderia glumae]MCQ0035231.1 hypothetical protein [Burkholderia glumae]UVS86693.1 hypothetical protein EFP18_21410 [Burkholderia glumae]